MDTAPTPAPPSDPLHAELTKGDNKRFLLVAAGLILLLIGLVLAMSIMLKGKFFQPLSTPSQQNDSVSAKNLQQWINCNDVRDIISEGNTFYVACYGGVLVMDKSGRIQKQLTKTTGLGNHVTTSLVKINDELYIGSQDGMTKYNLKTDEAKKISVAEGLANGANIILERDGTDIWVGTFNGLSRYSTSDGTIKNYTSELADNSETYNIQDLLVTQTSVYAIITAHAGSAGGVARFDKQTQTWEKFGYTAFYDPSENKSRADLYNLTFANNNVYVRDSGKILWETANQKGSTWKKLPELTNKLVDSQDKYLILLGSVESKLYIQVGKTIFAVTPSTNTIESFFTYPDDQKLGIPYALILKENRLWETQSPKGMVATDIPSKNTFTLSFERPRRLTSLLSVIDDQLFLLADYGLHTLKDNTFTKHLDLEDQFADTASIFHPIVGTNKIFLHFQTCGQGCSEPHFYLYEYPNHKATKLSVPEDIQNKYITTDQFGKHYPAIVFDSFDSQTQTINLSVSGNRKLLYNTQKNAWKLGETTNQPTEILPDPIQRIQCIPSYSYNKNKKFEKITCNSEDISPFKISLDGTNNATLVNQEGGKVDYPVPPAEYSPFDDWNTNYFLSHVVPTEKSLFVVTSRGVSVYDKKTSSWKALTEKEGVLSNSNILTSLVATDSTLWLLTEAGLSSIPQ